ncbi:hypothetical protein ABH920_008579 [Catenulispora sp. EB89]|uniref:FtsX-like permease family protein n=1 Tax=Catenulispora sp. EB89 TaxID=3156257 RepID=UPI0035191960
MRRHVRRALRQTAHRLRTGLPATLVATSAALVFGTLGAFVAALAHSEPAAVLRGAPAADRVVRYLGTYRSDELAAEDAAVAAAARRVLGDVPGAVYRLDASPVLTVGGGGAEPFSVAAVTVAGGGIGEHAALTAGRWPGVSAPGEIAIPASLAGAENLNPGSVLTVGADSASSRSLVVVGVYRPDGSAFWQALPPAALPQVAADPAQVLVVDSAALAVLGRAGSVSWIVDPRLDGLSPARLSGLVDRADAAIVQQDARAVPGAAFISPPIIVSSALPERRLVARRTAVAGEAELAVPAGVLILLAGTAMVRAARSVAARRRADLVLARGRGAGSVKLLAAVGLEGLGVGVPLVVAVPLVAPAAARLLAATAHVRGLTFPATAAQSVLIAATVAAAQALLALAAAWPDAVERAPGAAFGRRGARVARFQRAGTDLILAAVAAWGLAELHHYRSPLAARISAQTATGGGTDSLDPVLILVPALVTGALAILALRLLPLLARPLDRHAARRRGVTGAFGAWQVSRRTTRLTGALLLMVMAISVGALALTATAMRTANTGDQAAFAVGADVRIDSSALPPLARRAAYTATPGVTAATPYWSTAATTADGTHTATTLIGVDPHTAGAVMAFGPGTATPSARNALAHLGGTALGGLPLPGRPVRLTVAMTTTVSDGALPADSELELTLTDADGLTVTRAEPLTSNDATNDVKSDVTFDLAGTGTPTYPLRVTAISVLTPESPTTHLVRIDLRAITGTAADGIPTLPATSPDANPWQITAGQHGASGRPGNDSMISACPEPVPQPAPGQEIGGRLCRSKASAGALVTLAFLTPGINTTGTTDTARPPQRGPLNVTATLPAPLADGLAPALPAVVSQDLLTATGTHIGDTITVTPDEAPTDISLPAGLGSADELRALDAPAQLTLRITGVVAAVPGQGADTTTGPAAILDLSTLADQLSTLGVPPPTDTPWLLKTAPGGNAELEQALAAHPALGTPILRTTATTAARADVFHAGSAALFAACVVLAPLFALLGFAMDTVVSIRERSRGFAALRAFGARPRELASALLIEQGVVAVVALLAGTVIGAGVAAITEPLLATSSDGSAAQPAMAVLIPWLRAGGLGLATVAAVVAVLSGIARAAAALDLARVLRAGEDL